VAWPLIACVFQPMRGREFETESRGPRQIRATLASGVTSNQRRRPSMVRDPACRRDTRPELRPVLLSKNRFEWTCRQGSCPAHTKPGQQIGAKESWRRTDRDTDQFERDIMAKFLPSRVRFAKPN
jgi:hypothetical protein